MNKLNLKIIAPIFVALLMSTIWILSSKNNTGETKLTKSGFLMIVPIYAKVSIL
jgi:hypothetical protein